MNDEQILERGGTEEDIRKYAEENGANLTREDVLDTEKQKIREEYYSWFKDDTEYTANDKEIADYWLQILDKVIKSKLEAVEEEIEELGDLWKLDKSISEQGGGYPVKVTADILNIINKHK